MWSVFVRHCAHYRRLKINSSSGKKNKINSHRIKQNLHWMFKITNKWHVPRQFWKKTYTGWEDRAEKDKEIKVVFEPRHHVCCPIYSFLCTVLVTLPRLGHISVMIFWGLQCNLAVHINTYMLTWSTGFWSFPHLFLSQCNRITSTKVYL